MNPTPENRVIKRAYDVTKSGRPYLLMELESGRVISQLLPMPKLSELLRDASSDESSQRHLVQVYARGWQSGATAEREKRNTLLAAFFDLMDMNLDELEAVTNLSRGYLIDLLRSRGLSDRAIGVQVSKRRRSKRRKR